MMNILQEELAAALQREIPGLSSELAARRARDLIVNTDSRLEENVRQWIAGKPISDVWIGKYCINAILDIRQDRDFLSALEAMNLYLQDPQRGEMRIWRARR